MTAPRQIWAASTFFMGAYSWAACREGNEKHPDTWGRAATEEGAIADLLAKEDEAADDAAYAEWCEAESRRDDAREGFDE